MARLRLRSALLVAVAFAAVAAPSALAQVRGQVGQAPEPQELMQAGQQRRAPAAGVLPSMDDDQRAQEDRRRAEEARRASANAGAPIVTGRVRYPTQRQVRNMRNLTRPPNRAVQPPAPFAAPGAAGAVPAAALQPSPVVAPGLSVPPPVRKKRIEPEKDPYAPLGLRLEGFRILPAIEGAVGYDTNPLRTSSGQPIKGSMLYQVSPELAVRSDWSRNALSLDLRGTYSYYPDVDNANRPTLDGKLTFRGDIREQSTLTLELKEKVDSQRPGSADLTSAVKGRPLFFVTSGSLAWAEKFGYATVTATGLIDRADYQDGVTVRGAIVPQGDRNYTAYGAKLRGAYELTPGVAPFVEIGGDMREHDLAVDFGGTRRNSVGATVKAGATVEFSRILTGEVSAGWGLRDYEDRRLDTLSGAVVDASLVWQASPLTKITAKAGTEFIETTQNGSPGALGRKASLEVSHDLLRNFTLTANAGFSNADYKGINRIEDTITAGLKADYKIDRMLVVRGSYAYERTLSSLPGSSYLSHLFLMGVRLQR